MHVDLTTVSEGVVDPYLATARRLGGSEFLLNIVPHTAVSAFTEGNVLQWCFFRCYLPSDCSQSVHAPSR
jgi:aerobic C4-dicarboxylate transport protein